MKDTTKGDPFTRETFNTVLEHLKYKNKNMFRHITKAGQYFQDARYINMAHMAKRTCARHIQLNKIIQGMERQRQ